MRGTKVQVTLSEGDLVLRNWEIPCKSSLTEIVTAVKHIKESLNDYLTQLIDCRIKDQIELSDTSDQEEEDQSDCISGFIRSIDVNQKAIGCEKRKIGYLHQSKKIKK